MKQILNNVYWLDLGMVNSYLCLDDDGLCLIDTGISRSAAKILDAVAELGKSPQDITRILLTHADIDHAGGLATCLAASGATVYAGSESVSLVTKGKSPKHLSRPLQFVSDMFTGYQAVHADTITIVHEGDIIPALGGMDVLATPGHTMDHLSFYCPSMGVLFAGDILSTRSGKLQLTAPFMTADQGAANRSALRLTELAPAIIACGHGAPLTDHAADAMMILAQDIRTN